MNTPATAVRLSTLSRSRVKPALNEAKFIWLDGELVPWRSATVHSLTHALAHGTGVFEGMRCFEVESGPAIFRLSDHLARLFDSARTMLMDIPWSSDDLGSALISLIRENEQSAAYIRMIAYRAYGEMFINPARNPISVVIASWVQPPSYAADKYKNGIRVTISSWRRPDANTVPSRAKVTGLYVTAGLARMEAERAGYDDAIMLAASGTLSEAVIANLFLVRDGALLTPSAADGPLLGITRATVLQLARDAANECQERSLSRQDLYGADEAFLTGTGVGVVPIREVDGRAFPAARPLTDLLSAGYAEATQGRARGYGHWLTPAGRAFATTGPSLRLDAATS